MKIQYPTPAFIFAVGLGILSASLQAAGLIPTGGGRFGQSVDLSGNSGLVGAVFENIGINNSQGSAYLYRDLDTATGNTFQNVKLIASDGATGDGFGIAVGLAGSIGLAGASMDDIGTNLDQGSAYVFRTLDTATGTINQNAKLSASDGASGDNFGNSLSISGTIGLVGAYQDDISFNTNQGSAYLFRNLDTATGNVTENAKLTASDGTGSDNFGGSVSLSGSVGLVGAYFDNSTRGSAYIFRNLDTATGNVNEVAKLTASDGAISDYFGRNVSLSGSIAVISANEDTIGANIAQGSAYVYRDLDAANGNVTQNAKLTASNGAASDNFGSSVSVSGSVGMVGANLKRVGSNSFQGSAYIFLNLDTATGSITQNVQVTASDGEAFDQFGTSVSVEGDLFLIGAIGKNLAAGKAYSGSIAAMTTLDAGNTSKTISGTSFVSIDDWIIGKTTDRNTVTLSAGDTANISAIGKAIHIGQNAGADLNKLVVSGNLTATELYVGSILGNVENILELKNGATFAAQYFRLALGNSLLIEGNYLNFTTLLAYLGSTQLQTWDGAVWQDISAGNAANVLQVSQVNGSTLITAIPEPGTSALVLAALLGCLAVRRKRVVQ